MPFTRISLREGKSSEYLKALSDSFHQAMVDTFNVPPTDKFQAIHQHRAEELIIDPTYFSDGRSEDFVIFTIAIGKPRDTATKQAFYKRVVDLLGKSPGIRPEDVMIVVSTSTRDDISFSNGDTQMVEGLQP